MNDTATAIIPLCRHLKTNGRQCQSPALRGGPLCFFHAKLQHAHRRPAVVQPLNSGWQEYAIESEGDPEGDIFAVNRVYPKQDEIEFPPLEDAESVQLATSMLFQAIATGQIYFKRARLLLYTLKIASINQRALANARAADSDKPVPTRIVRTTQGQFLAPPDDETSFSPAEPTPPEVQPTYSSKLTAQSSPAKTARLDLPAASRAENALNPDPKARHSGPKAQNLGICSSKSATDLIPSRIPPPITQTEPVFCP